MHSVSVCLKLNSSTGTGTGTGTVAVTALLIILCLFGTLPNPTQATAINLKDKLAVQQKSDKKVLSATDRYCTRNTLGRDIKNSRLVGICDPGDQPLGSTCYKPCRSGYTAVGGLCYQNCPSGYSDSGTTCYTLPDQYGKGCCCTVFGCCNVGCNPGYHDDGGCLCVRAGNSFAKDIYQQESYTAKICDNGYEEDQSPGGLLPNCFSICPAGYTNYHHISGGNIVGSVAICYQLCPLSYPVDHGLLCAQTSDAATPNGDCPFN